MSMMDNTNLWNVKNLQPPAFTTFKSDNYKIDIKKLIRICQHANQRFANLKQLDIEAALLSRCIYRSKVKLRSDRGLKEMEKTNHALRQYLNMNYTKTIDDFVSMLPLKYENETYFPSRNVLDYVLVRTQGLCKLLCRIAECSKEAAYYLHYRMHIGQYWKVALISFAIVSRIFTIVKYLIKYTCELHANLLEQRMHFKNTSPNWLIDEYNHPQVLETWIDVDWLIINNQHSINYRKPNSDVEFCGVYHDVDDDIEVVDEYIKISDDIKTDFIAEQDDDIEIVDQYFKFVDDNKSDIVEIQDDLKAIENYVETNLNKKHTAQKHSQNVIISDDNESDIEMEDDFKTIENYAETKLNMKPATHKNKSQKQNNQLRNKLLVIEDDVGDLVTDINVSTGVNRSIIKIQDDLNKIEKYVKTNLNKKSTTQKHLKQKHKIQKHTPQKQNDQLQNELFVVEDDVGELLTDNMKSTGGKGLKKELKLKLQSISTLVDLSKFHQSDQVMKKKYPEKWKKINNQIKLIIKNSHKKKRSNKDLIEAKKAFKIYFV